jgi:hypothetical protein
MDDDSDEEEEDGEEVDTMRDFTALREAVRLY